MKKSVQDKLANFYQMKNITKFPEIYFDHTPAYSPDYDLAEYIIHQIRQQLMYHLPINTPLLEIEDRLNSFFKSGQLQTPSRYEIRLIRLLILGSNLVLF